MMTGGGGSSSRADHGIGITETNDASFIELEGGETEYDFGYDANAHSAPPQAYSLNLWIRRNVSLLKSFPFRDFLTTSRTFIIE